MSYKISVFCRKFSLVTAFLLLLQAGFSQYDFSKVDDWLNANLNEIGGRAVLVIYKDGKLVYSKAVNELNSKQKMATRFVARKQGKDAKEMMADFTVSSKERIASCSKWLSAAMVMSFVDEGKLSLEDTVGKFLPTMTVNGKGNIKIWQCLSHLTGIKPGSLKESLASMKDMKSMDEAMTAIAKMPMEGEPGKTFHYSNTGLQIAGAVIEKISGKSFEALFAERIAKPCNMINSDFGNGPVALPAGGAWSTSEDYGNFLQMILHEGVFNGRQVLSKNAVIEMQKNRVGKDATIVSSPSEAGNWGYGFGEWVMNESRDNNRSDAVTSPGLFGSFPWVDNKKQYAGFLMTLNINNKGRNKRYTALKKLVDEALTIQ